MNKTPRDQHGSRGDFVATASAGFDRYAFAIAAWDGFIDLGIVSSCDYLVR